MICWSSTQPTRETTTADSSSVLITTRAWIERRQTVAARRHAGICGGPVTGPVTAYCAFPAL